MSNLSPNALLKFHRMVKRSERTEGKWLSVVFKIHTINGVQNGARHVTIISRSVQPVGTQATRGEPPSALPGPGARAVLPLWLGSGRSGTGREGIRGFGSGDHRAAMLGTFLETMGT